MSVEQHMTAARRNQDLQFRLEQNILIYEKDFI